jgi:hypothetical protein
LRNISPKSIPSVFRGAFMTYLQTDGLKDLLFSEDGCVGHVYTLPWS